MYYDLLVLIIMLLQFIIMLLQLIAQYSQKSKIIYATVCFNDLEDFYLKY